MPIPLSCTKKNDLPSSSIPQLNVITSFCNVYLAALSTRILAVCLSGTDLQRQVWKALLQVHKGKTTSYTQIAQTVGRPKAVRAVASAIGKNPVSWIIPCHRILHKDGSLSGYRWDAKRKQQLLEWEKNK